MRDYYKRTDFTQIKPRTLTKWKAIPSSLTFHWEGGNVDSHSHEAASKALNAIISYHMSLKNANGSNTYQYGAYNFAISQAGGTYEIRGEDNQNGANGTSKANGESMAILFLVGPGQKLTEAAKTAAIILGADLLARNKITSTKAFPHNHWIATQCPGPELTAFAEHFSGIEHVNTGEKPPLAAKPKPTNKFPLPTGHYFGQLNYNDDRNHSGYGVPKDQIEVKRIQKNVGVTTDGLFGPITNAAVRRYQQKRGVRIDGLVGIITWTRLIGRI